jgi:hypothetical protein
LSKESKEVSKVVDLALLTADLYAAHLVNTLARLFMVPQGRWSPSAFTAYDLPTPKRPKTNLRGMNESDDIILLYAKCRKNYYWIQVKTIFCICCCFAQQKDMFKTRLVQVLIFFSRVS